MAALTPGVPVFVAQSDTVRSSLGLVTRNVVTGEAAGVGSTGTAFEAAGVAEGATLGA
jgi:hypothetical protein